MDSNFRYRARKARDFHNIPEVAGTARVRYGWRHRPHQARALHRYSKTTSVSGIRRIGPELFHRKPIGSMARPFHFSVASAGEEHYKNARGEHGGNASIRRTVDGRKLDAVRAYLGADSKALKNQPFQGNYIDAFVGTGDRAGKRQEAQTVLESLNLT